MGVRMMIDVGMIDHALVTHITWKAHLRDAIEAGRSPWTVDDVKSEVMCEFGRWLRDASVTDRRSAHWKKVRRRHAEFHQAAADVLALARDGRQKDAEEALAPGGLYGHASARLVKALMAWKAAVTADQGG